MNNKVCFDICSLVNFDYDFRKRFNTKFNVRNYFCSDDSDEPNIADIYFKFDYIPNEDMIQFIRNYAASVGGIAVFSSDKTKFEIFKNND